MVDYLKRDARHCNVQYGFGIDTVRLLRCLTVAYDSIGPDQLLMVVGVHEKGRISAESILFAQYAMLTQVYWHHTMRSIKSLVHHAASEVLAGLEASELDRLHENFLRCAILNEEVTDSGWRSVVKDSAAVSSIDAGDLRMLGWLWKNAALSGLTAVEHILNRDLFKRLLVLYQPELTGTERRTLERAFRPGNYRERLRLRESIQRAITSSIENATIPRELLETQGFTPEGWQQRMEEGVSLRCLVDYPSIRQGSAFGLYVVRQWGDKPGRRPPESIGPSKLVPMIIPSKNFKDGMRELEKSIASLRIFWHPREEVVVREVLGQERIREIIGTELATFEAEIEETI